MNITLLKKSGAKEVINRVELAEMAAAIKDGMIKRTVTHTREVYHLMNPHRLEDGQISTQWEGGIKLPRICFAADYRNRKGLWQMMAYNGLVVLEVNDLPSYEKAVEIRELAKKLPETMLCFLGGSGKDKLFEQIANVERPKEFGCEFGRGLDLIRWGFFYTNERLQQLKEHGTFLLTSKRSLLKTPLAEYVNKDVYIDADNDKWTVKSSYTSFNPGHEFIPIPQTHMNANPNLEGNSANNNTDNASYFTSNGWTVHPVVDLSK